MKPVDQTIMHEPENGRYGDCFRCCIASLLELPAEQVPHFCEDGQPTNWYVKLKAWLAQFDLTFIEIDVSQDGGAAWREAFKDCEISVYHTIVARSPRFPTENHSVVGLNGNVVFDPHPDRAGLAGGETSFGFLVKTCGGAK